MHSITFSLASSSSFRFRDKRTRILVGTFLIPRDQTCLFNESAILTSLIANIRILPATCIAAYFVFIACSAKLFISRMARGARFLKVTPHRRLLKCMVYSLVTISGLLVLASFTIVWLVNATLVL